MMRQCHQQAWSVMSRYRAGVNVTKNSTGRGERHSGTVKTSAAAFIHTSSHHAHLKSDDPIKPHTPPAHHASLLPVSPLTGYHE